jgi:hypothetical protein
MAGFRRAAQLMYLPGASQNVTGAMVKSVAPGVGCRELKSDNVDWRHKPASHHRAVVQCSGQQARDDDEGTRE